MLAWFNALGLNRRYLRLLRPGDQRALRRQNRAREAADTRGEVLSVTATPHHETWLERWSEERPFDMNDEYSCPSTAVWRALAENECALASVDFEGTYVTESEKV